MTSSESEDDEGLEDRLRRALSEAAGGVEPGADGLDKIRGRIARRPPRPWLASVLFGLAERVRNWTWRGHWAWPDRLSRRAEAWWSRLRRGRFPSWGIGSLGLAAALAAVALIASATLGVQPLRNAFHQAGSVLQGGGGPQSAAAGTEANGTPDITPGNDASSPGAAPVGTGSTPRDTKTPGTTKLHNAGACATSAAAPAATQASLTNVRASASAGVATTPATAPAVSGSATAADSAAANASAVTCPVSPTKSATPTPTATATATASSGDSTPVTDTPTPTVSDSAPWPTPTDSAWSPDGGGPGPSDPPHDRWPGPGHRH